MTINTPDNVDELLVRAGALAGLTIDQLAQRYQLSAPASLTHAKGWIGQLLELALGANAGTAAAPDFLDLGIELKTIPLDQHGNPKETTFVTSIDCMKIGSQNWRNSTVYQKLRHVLWVPIEAASTIPISDRRIGTPLLRPLTPELEDILERDWNELSEIIAQGNIETLTSSLGVLLHVRPKCANGRSLCNAPGPDGRIIRTLPRGFYLRTEFSRKILSLID